MSVRNISPVRGECVLWVAVCVNLASLAFMVVISNTKFGYNSRADLSMFKLNYRRIVFIWLACHLTRGWRRGGRGGG